MSRKRVYCDRACCNNEQCGKKQLLKMKYDENNGRSVSIPCFLAIDFFRGPPLLLTFSEALSRLADGKVTKVRTSVSIYRRRYSRVDSRREFAKKRERAKKVKTGRGEKKWWRIEKGGLVIVRGASFAVSRRSANDSAKQSCENVFGKYRCS